LRKLKRGVHNLTLILRRYGENLFGILKKARFTVQDELKIFSPCIARLGQLEKLKVEFPE